MLHFFAINLKLSVAHAIVDVFIVVGKLTTKNYYEGLNNRLSFMLLLRQTYWRLPCMQIIGRPFILLSRPI